MLRISIIIPVYNNATYLRQCIDSILAQSFSDFELLLVDDGSSDGSGGICDEYTAKDSRIKVFHQQNAGVGAARNLGMEMAVSPWITFIDSDDCVDENYLASFRLDEIEEDTLAVQGIKYFFPSNGKEKVMFGYPDKKVSISSSYAIRDLDLLGNGCPVAKLFSKKIIENSGLKFNTHISLNEDHVFVTSYYALIKNVRLLSHIGYSYRKGYSETSLTGKIRSVREYLDISKLMADTLLILCERLGVKPTEICSDRTRYIYGLMQIIHAIRISATSFERNRLFESISERYSDLDSSLKGCTVDIYGKILTTLLDSGHRKMAYSYAYIHFVKHTIVKKIFG